MLRCDRTGQHRTSPASSGDPGFPIVNRPARAFWQVGPLHGQPLQARLTSWSEAGRTEQSEPKADQFGRWEEGAMRRVALTSAAMAVVLGLVGVVALAAASQAAEPGTPRSKTLTFDVVFSPFTLVAANNERDPNSP